MKHVLYEYEYRLRQRLADEKTQYKGAVYHYTSAEGLKSIIQSGKFWFSNAKFLNDYSETNYIFTLLPIFPDKYQEALINEEFHKDIRNIVESYKTGVFYQKDNDKLFADYVYIASFSKDRDNLEMWNYYTKDINSVGYNIGFTSYPFDIPSVLPQFQFIHGEVIYKKKKQEELVKNIVLTYNSLYEDYYELIKGDKKTKKYFLKSFVRTLELYNIFFKHKSYENEKEYRCAIYNITNYAGLDLRSRAINGILVPYIEIPYEFDFINSIGVSPSSEKELLEEGVEFLWFSKVKGEKPISVWSSNIPKRY